MIFNLEMDLHGRIAGRPGSENFPHLGAAQPIFRIVSRIPPKIVILEFIPGRTRGQRGSTYKESFPLGSLTDAVELITSRVRQPFRRDIPTEQPVVAVSTKWRARHVLSPLGGVSLT